MEKIFYVIIFHINTLTESALHMSLQISMNHYRIRISRFDFFSSIMGIAICTHISKLYIIDVNYVIYNIYMYYDQYPSSEFSMERKEVGYREETNTYFVARQKWSQYSEEKEPRSTY